MNLHSSVTFPEQRFLSLAEAQRHGDFVGLRQFSERGPIHLSGEGSSPSLQSATTAFSCNLDSSFAFSPQSRRERGVRRERHENWGFFKSQCTDRERESIHPNGDRRKRKESISRHAKLRESNVPSPVHSVCSVVSKQLSNRGIWFPIPLFSGLSSLLCAPRVSARGFQTRFLV